MFSTDGSLPKESKGDVSSQIAGKTQPEHTLHSNAQFVSCLLILIMFLCGKRRTVWILLTVEIARTHIHGMQRSLPPWFVNITSPWTPFFLLPSHNPISFSPLHDRLPVSSTRLFLLFNYSLRYHICRLYISCCFPQSSVIQPVGSSFILKWALCIYFPVHHIPAVVFIEMLFRRALRCVVMKVVSQRWKGLFQWFLSQLTIWADYYEWTCYIRIIYSTIIAGYMFKCVIDNISVSESVYSLIFVYRFWSKRFFDLPRTINNPQT